MVSCTDDALVNTPPTTAKEGKVAINLSLYLPELSQVQSRAFSNSDADGYLSYLQSCPLQLVVFDENGVLVEAHDITPTGNDEKDQVNFIIELETSADPRRIHCIVNSPVDAIEYEEFGLESDLIGELSKALSDEKDNNTDRQDAYWQLVELTHIADDDYTEGKLTRIPMIRNFVKISVNTSITDASDFELLGYAVVNEWDKGTVAPYKGSGAFASLNNGERMKDYTTITNTEKYEGVWPSDAQLINTDASTVTFKEFSSSTADGATTYTGESYYMYERRNTYVSDDIPPTYLLIKGIYKKNEGGAESYYKLDLVYDLDDTGVNKQYYNLLRNFHYQINIEDVIGNGYATAKEAAEHAASNNLSGAIDIRDLTNISDAVDRLFVSYTDYTVVDNTNPVAIKYRFLNNENKFTNTGVVTSIKEQTACPIKDVYYKKADGTIVYIYDDGVKVEGYTANIDIPQDTDGWSTVYVTFEKIPTDFKVYTNVLTFACQGLIREVDYNLRRIMYMMVECDPNSIAKGVGNSVTANILIPVGITGENDPYQLFPLNFLVEAENMTLSPDATTNGTNITLSPSEMPVFTGTSIIPDKAATNKQTFRYQRTVTNAEYQALSANTVERTVMYNGQEIKGTYVQIPCHFLTNTSVSATAVYAQNEYFTLIKEGYFSNFEGTGLNRYGIGNEVSFNYTPSTTGTYTITWTEGENKTTSTVSLTEGVSTDLTYTTKTWSDEMTLTIVTPTGESIVYKFGERYKLFIKAATSGTSLSDATTLNVYSDNNYSISLDKITDGELNSGVEISYPGLSSDETQQTEITNKITLYFMYSVTTTTSTGGGGWGGPPGNNNQTTTTTTNYYGSMSLTNLIDGGQTIIFQQASS